MSRDDLSRTEGRVAVAEDLSGVREAGMSLVVPTKPAYLSLKLDAIPAVLRAQPWIGWKAQLDDDGTKWRKEPRQIAYPDRLAANNRPDDWRGVDDVEEMLVLTGDELFDGFGIVLTELAEIVFVDIDHCRDPLTGAIAPWVERIIRLLDSWTEISVSGTGIHVFARGRVRKGLNDYLDGDPRQKVELYSSGRFAYLTGHVLHEAPVRAQQALVSLLASHLRPVGSRGLAGGDGPKPSRDPAPIADGQRNDRLFRIARSLVNHGLRGEALARALLDVNQQRCVPPLSAFEVRTLARHAVQLPDRRPA